MDKRLYLKRNWDNVLSWYKDIDLGNPETKIVFGGRNKEQEKINDFLLRRNQGSLLVSGDRGSGKTSLVIKTIFDPESKKNILPVCINAVRLEALKQERDSFLDLTHLLRQLIKSLDRELKRKGIKYSLNEFIGDIDATEIVQRYKKSFVESSQGRVGVSTKMGMTDMNLPIINLSGGLESELSGCYEKNRIKEKIIEKRGLSIEDLVDRFSNIIQEIEKKIIYIKEKEQKDKKADDSIIEKGKKANWFYRLKGFFKTNFLKKVYRGFDDVDYGGKIVFIIDELDFYDDKGEKVDYILNTLKKFKNLFTLSNAQFIFIVGKNTYLKTLEKDMYRTLFSDKFFLPAPSSKDLSGYLDKIIENSDLNKLKETGKKLRELWRAHKFLLIQASDHNYYNLIQQVRSVQKNDISQRKIYLELRKLKESEKFLGELHMLLSSIHEHYQKEPLYWHINDKILHALYEIEKSYMSWTHTREGGITIWLSDQDEDYDDLEKNARREVKIAFIRSIYNSSGDPIPDNLEKMDKIEMSWDDLSSSISTANRGLRGSITGEDYEFTDFYNNLFSKAQDMIDLVSIGIDNKSFEDMIQSLIDNNVIDFTKEQVVEVKKANEEMNSKILPDRDYPMIKSAINSLHNLQSQFDSLIINLKNKNIFKIDYGDINYNKKENSIDIVFDGSHSNRFLGKLTLVNRNIIDNNFNLRLRAKLNEEDSILNILIITQEGTNEEESKYYMLRLDARDPSATVGDGILLKEPHGGWGYIDGLEHVRGGSISGERYVVEVENDSGNLVFWKRTERSKRRKKIAEIQNVESENIKIGFAIEKNGVELKDVELSF